MKFKKQIHGDPIVNLIIAHAEGQKTHSRPFTFVCGEKEYSHITGGIILPTFDIPGFLLTVGVRPESQIIDCLDEFESHNPHKLIKRAQAIQKEYGREVIGNWWGNPDSLMPLVNEINIEGNPVYISSPVDSDQGDDFHIYLSRIQVALSETYQTFFLNHCDLLRNHISAFIQDRKAKAEEHPAFYIAGALIHTLLMMRPWEQAVESVDLIPTHPDDIGLFTSAQEKKEMYDELYGIKA